MSLPTAAQYRQAVQPLVTTPVSDNKRLTGFAHGGGCGCKLDPSQLSQLLEGVPKGAHTKLVVGLEHSDDAAVYEMPDGRGLVFTNDFQTPIVDDPFIYGCQAAANALSDVWAMGATPIMATAIAGFPAAEVPIDRLKDVIRGGVETCQRIGIPLAGGHTIDNPIPIFGLAVVGTVDLDKIKRNSSARPGDIIILTRPLGTGVLASGFRIDMLEPEGYTQLVQSITALNSAGAWLGQLPEVHALTDVTGFGLAGHLVEMAEGAGVSMRVRLGDVPVLSHALELARQGVFPGGAYRNLDAYASRLAFEHADIDGQLLYADPQTNGGLLMTVAPQAASRILADLRHQHGCPEAKIIGEVRSGAGRQAVEFVA